jgi:hypothetical protein
MAGPPREVLQKIGQTCGGTPKSELSFTVTKQLSIVVWLIRVNCGGFGARSALWGPVLVIIPIGI